MARFAYVAMNDKGIEVSGTVNAEDTVSAINQIREMGYFPTSVTVQKKRKAEAAEAAAAEKGGALSFQIKFLTRKSVKSKILALFTRQLATLIDAGLPLLKALQVLESQQKVGPLKDALVGMSAAVEGGSTFSEALGESPKIFNKLFVNMVKAGEAGGVLEVVLNRMAEFLEKTERLKSKVKAALIYPVAVITVAVGVLTFLMAYVIPKFKEIFAGFNTTLPTPTAILISISSWVQGNLYYKHPPYVGMLILIPVGLFFALKALARTEKGKVGIDTAKLNFPLFGTLVRKVAIARFSRTLGTLITSGVPILQALNIVRETSGNEVVSRAVENVHDSIREGESIVAPLKDTKVFTPMVISMIEVGEETGKLPDMLMKIADNYDDDVDNAVAGITSVIEPVLIVFLAVMVGFIVISLFLPLIKLITSINAQSEEGTE
jgi:type IV pilus assembly protein PilC